MTYALNVKVPANCPLVADTAERFAMSADAFLEAILAKLGEGESVSLTYRQLLQICLLIRETGLNPFVDHIFMCEARDDRDNDASRHPELRADGWIAIMNQHPAFDGLEFSFADEWHDNPLGALEEGPVRRVPAWVEAIIHRSDRSRPVVVREFFSEVYEEDDFWRDKPLRQLRLRALTSAIRMAFGKSCGQFRDSILTHHVHEDAAVDRTVQPVTSSSDIDPNVEASSEAVGTVSSESDDPGAAPDPFLDGEMQSGGESRNDWEDPLAGFEMPMAETGAMATPIPVSDEDEAVQQPSDQSQPDEADDTGSVTSALEEEAATNQEAAASCEVSEAPVGNVQDESVAEKTGETQAPVPEWEPEIDQSTASEGTTRESDSSVTTGTNTSRTSREEISDQGATTSVPADPEALLAEMTPAEAKQASAYLKELSRRINSNPSNKLQALTATRNWVSSKTEETELSRKVGNYLIRALDRDFADLKAAAA